MLSHSSGELLDVCKLVVFYLTSFDICFRQLKYLFCLLVLVATATVDETAQRKKLVDCINKVLVKENADYGHRDDELKKTTEIVDRVVMKEPVKSYIIEEQKQIFSEIEYMP